MKHHLAVLYKAGEKKKNVLHEFRQNLMFHTSFKANDCNYLQSCIRQFNLLCADYQPGLTFTP